MKFRHFTISLFNKFSSNSMAAQQTLSSSVYIKDSFRNPVFHHDFPDPFILKYHDGYWAYCTGIRSDGRAFGIMHSNDLIHWDPIDSAMDQLPGDHPCYWAPEVTYLNGTFYLYYSVGNEINMQLRVATSDSPQGPFTDSGRVLSTEPFAIDPHLFIENDGSMYLFYATDYLEHTHIGTGTACIPLSDPFTPAGPSHIITRARYDWQVYDPARKEKGGVRWHTVEGPFVLKHKNKYYEMFSGGNWQNISYGVSYATSTVLFPEGEWEQVSDGVAVLPILKTIPGVVVGPGHNSVVRGPDNRQLYCIYHQWATDQSGRVLSIDRMDWKGEGIIVLGPTVNEQPVPNRPSVKLEILTNQEVTFDHNDFLLEFWIRSTDHPYALTITTSEGPLHFSVDEERGYLEITMPDHEHRQIALPKSFSASAYQLFRIERNYHQLSLCIINTGVVWEQGVSGIAQSIKIVGAADVRCFELTYGWEDLFTKPLTLQEMGWRPHDQRGGWYIEHNELWFANPEGESSLLSKGSFLENYEVVINARLVTEESHDSSVGFCPSLGKDGLGPIFRTRFMGGSWLLLYDGPSGTSHYPLGSDFDSAVYQQFRFRKENGEMTIQWNTEVLGSVLVTKEPTQIGLFVNRAVAAFDLVRVTAI